MASAARVDNTHIFQLILSTLRFDKCNICNVGSVYIKCIHVVGIGHFACSGPSRSGKTRKMQSDVKSRSKDAREILNIFVIHENKPVRPRFVRTRCTGGVNVKRSATAMFARRHNRLSRLLRSLVRSRVCEHCEQFSVSQARDRLMTESNPTRFCGELRQFSRRISSERASNSTGDL